MGDILSLVEQAQQQYDKGEAEKLEKKMSKGEFSLEDFAGQLRKMRQMGSFKEMIKKIPGMGDMMGGMDFDEQEIVRMEAVVQSMTPTERSNPKIIDASRRRRIAKGAGVDPNDVSQLVKQFEPMRAMMKAMSGQSFMQRLRMGTQFSNMMAGGGMPKLKGSTAANKRVLSKKDKKKRRKR